MFVEAKPSTKFFRQTNRVRGLEADPTVNRNENDDHESLPEELEQLDKKRMDLLYAAAEKTKISTRSSSSKSSLIPDCCVEVEVAFHIIEDRNGESNAAKLWTQTAIEEEIGRVNEDFAPLTPFEFKLLKITRTKNDAWSQMDDDDDDGIDLISKTLRVGGGDVLNVFVLDGLCRKKGGFAQYPYEHGWWPQDTFSPKDRVFMCATNIGLDWTGDTYHKTTTHEIGHWLGLRHTFQGDSCDPDNDGDYVDDTPQHLRNGNCREEYDTCPNQPGVDPVDNFMNYSDGCRNRFTPGQAQRMVYQFHTYRRRIFDCNSDEATAYFTVKFDNHPEDMEVAYAEYDETGDRDWRTLKDEDPEDHVDYSNQEFTRQVCMPSQKMFAFHVADEARNGFQNGGFVSLTVNGRVMASATSFDVKWYSTFVIADACKHGESLFMFEIEPDGGSDDLTWEITDKATNDLLIDPSDTVIFADKAWRRILHQKCLSNDREYVFTIRDAAGNGIWGFYKLWLEDKELFKGGGSRGFDDQESFSFRVETNHPTVETPQPTPPPTPPPTIAPSPIPVPAPTRQPTYQPTNQPTRPPTRHPTAAPSSKPTGFPTLISLPPTLEPTEKLSDSDPLPPTMAPLNLPPDFPWGCFSGQSAINVLGQGLTSMKDLRLGDFVQVDGATGRYEQIYSFGHYHPDAQNVQYLEIIATNTNSTGADNKKRKALQISNEHLIYTHNRGGMVPAGRLSVGDILDDGFGGSVRIQAITTKESDGQFAPFTSSGKLLVDGLLVSSYVVIGEKLLVSDSDIFQVGPLKVSYQWIAHSFQFPRRLICHYMTRKGYCQNESYDKRSGINKWETVTLQWGLWIMNQQSLVLTKAIMFAFVILLALFCMLECCLVLLKPISLLFAVVLWKGIQQPKY